MLTYNLIISHVNLIILPFNINRLHVNTLLPFLVWLIYIKKEIKHVKFVTLPPQKASWVGPKLPKFDQYFFFSSTYVGEKLNTYYIQGSVWCPSSPLSKFLNPWPFGWSSRVGPIWSWSENMSSLWKVSSLLPYIFEKNTCIVMMSIKRFFLIF